MKLRPSLSLNISIGITMVFIALRLTGVIDWSWWYVTLPFWGLVTMCLLVILPSLVVLGVTYYIDLQNYKRLTQTKK